MRGYRVGIVRPRSPFGRRVRALLDEGVLPVIELKLFEAEGEMEGAGTTLTQFGDEVVVTQPLDPDLFPHLDALLIGAEDGDTLNRIAARAAEDGVLTLVEGALGLGAPVVTPDRFEELRSTSNRLGVVPRVSSYLLGKTLAAIAKDHAIERAAATVLVPAQSLGDAGAEELHQQIVHILNFKTPPTEVLHEQLAFNVNLACGSPEAGLGVADSVGWEASGIAGIEAGNLAVNLVQVPVFHGYSASIWVETREPLDTRTIRAGFRSKLFESQKSSRSGKPPSPVSVAGSEAIHVGPVRRGMSSDHSGFWLWAVADTTAYDPGAAAIEIVRSVLGGEQA